MGLGLTRGNLRQRLVLTIAITPVGSERPPVERVNSGRYHAGGSLQRRQRVLRCLWVIKQQRRDAIGAGHLSLDREVVHHGLSKTNKIVGNKCHTRDTQGRATDQHVHSGQFLRNRMVGYAEHRPVSLQLESSFSR